MQTSIPAPHPGLPQPRRFWAIVAVALTITMSIVDQSIVNVALPSIARDLHIAASSTVWIVNAGQITILLTLLPLASVGDLLGYRNVYLTGIVIFTLGALCAALSGSLGALMSARILEGFGSAGLMSVNLALIRFIYPAHRLGYGIGINAVVIASASAAGPTLASFILAVAPWPWLFAVDVPLGILAFSIGFWALPHSPRGSHRFDYLSALLSAATFGALIAAIDSTSLPLFTAEALLMLGAGYLLCRRQVRMPVPMLPIDLLRIPLFALSISTSICSFMGQTFGLIALPFHLQHLGFTAVQTGLLMTPWPVATTFTAPIAGRLSDRYPAGLLGLAGMALFGIALGLLAFLPAHASMLDVIWRMGLAGIGYGLFQSPNNRTIQATAPMRRAGGAAGMQSVARLLGQTIGAALVALIFRLAGTAGPFAVLLAGTGVSLLASTVSGLRLTDLSESKPPKA